MNKPCDCGRLGHGDLTRRDLLAGGAAVAGLAALGPFRGLLPNASGAPMDLSRLVVLNMFGGNDTLSMVVPVNLGSYYSRRPTINIPANSTLSLNSGAGATTAYRLHPALPRIAALWAEGSVAAVQRVGYPQENLSHFTSMDIFSMGVRSNFGPLGIPQSGWAARFTDLYAPTPMGAVALGVGRMLDFEGGNTSAFLANNLSSFRLSVNNNNSPQVYRLNTAKALIQGYGGAGNAGEAKKSLNLAHSLADQVQASLTSYTTAVTYQNQFISQRLRDVAVLIQGGFETRIFYTGYGGFDTHGAQGAGAGSLATLYSQLDNAVGSFAQDMKNMGVWGKTVIYVLTEFGRRSYENGSQGTDHGHGFCGLLIGGAVKGGAYGPVLVDADINAEHPSYAVDFRSIYMDILQNHLGTDPAPVFPEPLEKTNNLGLIA